MDDSFEIIHEMQKSPIERYAARNAQTMADPNGAVWVTKFGGAWRIGTRLYLNTESVSSCPKLPHREHHAEETTSYLEACDTSKLPLVVEVASLPGCNENGLFSPAWPMQLTVVEPDPHRQENEDKGQKILLRGQEAQYFFSNPANG